MKERSFADELNNIDAAAGVEEGFLWFTNGEGDEFKEVGRFLLEQTNSGPDMFLADGFLVAKAWDGKKQHLASYNEDKRVWSHVQPAP